MAYSKGSETAEIKLIKVRFSTVFGLGEILGYYEVSGLLKSRWSKVQTPALRTTAGRMTWRGQQRPMPWFVYADYTKWVINVTQSTLWQLTWSGCWPVAGCCKAPGSSHCCSARQTASLSPSAAPAAPETQPQVQLHILHRRLKSL